MAINSEMILIWVKSKMLHGMKRIISNVMLVAAAAMAFFACQKQEEFQPEFEEVNGLAFTSEKPSFDDETKTHWTGETIQWSKGDNIRVAYTCGGVWQDANGNPEPGNYGKLYASKELSETTDVATFVVPGTFKGSEQGDYKFYGIYPSTLTSSTDLSSAPSVSIDIPSEQTPAVNSFDAKADVMVAQSDIYNGMPKNGEENGSISLKWNRLVAHGYITLKSLPVDGQEVVKSIVLTADAEADMVGKHKVNFNTQEVEKDGSNATNSIAINGTNLTIDANGNVTFWACFLPCTWNSISVSVETDKATYTLERDLVALDKTKTFAKNARNVLAINMTEADRAVKNASSLPFVQDFSGMTGQSEITELEGFSSIGGKVYNATGAIRLASGSADGSITTQLLDLSQNFHVKVTASGWDDNELALIVSTSEPSYTETVTLTAFGGGENFAEHIINFQPVSNSASLTFTAKEDVRCYIKKIEILEGHAVAAPVLKATAPNEIAAAGGEGSFNFTLANPQDGQSVSAESNVDWITGESVSGNTVTYTVAENTSEEPREGTITLSYEGAESVDVTITQAAKPSADAPVEVTDVLTRATTGVTSANTYASWSGKTVTSSAVYAGNSAGGNEAIQLRTNNSNSGVVTTASGGNAKKIVVTWHSATTANRILQVYGKNTPYTDATDLYNTNNQGTLLGTIKYGTSTELIITGDYQYVGLKSSSGAMYLTEIKITWSSESGSGSGETPEPEPDPTPDPEPETPVYSSLADLVAAGTPTTTGNEVTVTLTDEKITDIYVTSSGYRNGVFLQVGDREIEIYSRDVPADWVVGGTISGTLTDCVWKLYNSTWELCPTDWSELTYTAPESTEQPKVSRNLAFSSSTATATVGQPFTAPTLNGEKSGVTYTSSNPNAATVDESTGEVTLVAAGTTTITASASETDQYEAGTASYTLTVSAAQPDQPGQGGGDVQEYTYTWTATSGALGSTVNSTTTKTLNEVDWTIQRSGNGGFTGWSNNVIQIGSKNNPENLTLRTAGISGTVKSVSVACASYQAKHNISISVGDVNYVSKATPSWANNSVGTVVCEGNSTGDIEIKFTMGSGARALYIKSITIVYEN